MPYGDPASSNLLVQIVDTLENMTQLEQERLHVLLKREGISGFLTRPVLLNYTHKNGRLPCRFASQAVLLLVSRSAINPRALLIRATLRDLPIA